jgi:phosphatidylglycerophosphatase B
MQASVIATLRSSARFIIPACAALPLTYLIPKLPLDGVAAVFAYWITESGSKFAVPVIAIVMTGIVVGRQGISGKRRLFETAAIVIVLSLVLGAGAYVNEHWIKPWFAVPRPNIVELADAGALKMTVEAFYARPDKRIRSAHLRETLTDEQFRAVLLHPSIREHWIRESGFSFPSGHSLSAMLCATFFLAMGLELFRGRRRCPFYLLVLWAVLVCYSRPILRVHSTTDVSIGGLEGVVLGATSFILVRSILATTTHNASDASPS